MSLILNETGHLVNYVNYVLCRFKKRMKQSFEDEESFEDGQYPTRTAEQVRSMLMGMPEIGKM